MSRVEDQSPERLPWLESARQQSQALAELRAAHPAPFCRERPLPGRPRWAVAALAAGVLGLATVTLATLHARRRVAAPPSTPSVQPLGTRTVAAPRKAAPRKVVAPTPAVPEKAPPRRQRATRRAQPEKPTAAAPEAPAGTVTFDGNEPGDSVIIVTPPVRKMKPLWTPEQYKKERGGHLR